MTRVAVIVGSVSSEIASGAVTLPTSDRGAIALAMARFGGNVCAYAADADARCFARAAGIESVEEISNQENDSADVILDSSDAILDGVDVVLGGSDVVLGGVDVVLIGRGGCGEFGDALPARLAEQSGAALVYDVIDVQPKADRLAVTRDLGRGARDLLSVQGRVVLAVAESVERGPYVSQYRMNAQRTAAGKSPLHEDPSGEGSAARTQPKRVEWQSATPRVRLGDHAARVAGSAVERMNALFGLGETAEKAASLVRGSAEECARHLLRYLSHHGFVERGAVSESQGASEGVAASQRAERQPLQSAPETASVPVRLRRRPHLLKDRPLATRGPFEIGIDL
jgi:electron transfer flavoprotein alpha/beta subunit